MLVLSEIAIDADMASIYYDHLDQSEESDINFVTRIAEKHDAFAKFQDQKLQVRPRDKTNGLIFIKKESKTQLSIGGLVVTVATSLTATSASRNKYQSVKAYWHDLDQAHRTAEVIGAGEPQWQMKSTFETQGKAKQAAEAKLKQLQRGTGTLDSLTCPGNPAIRAEMDLLLVGFRPDVNYKWVVTSATHTMDNSGYKTVVKAEREL